MSDECEPMERHTTRIGRGATIFVAMLLIYVFSPIPLAAMLERIGMMDRLRSVFEIVYAPLGFLVENFDFVDTFYEWQRKLFHR